MQRYGGISLIFTLHCLVTDTVFPCCPSVVDCYQLNNNNGLTTNNSKIMNDKKRLLICSHEFGAGHLWCCHPTFSCVCMDVCVCLLEGVRTKRMQERNIHWWLCLLQSLLPKILISKCFDYNTRLNRKVLCLWYHFAMMVCYRLSILLNNRHL